MVARARVLPDAHVADHASGELSIAQALLRLLDANTPDGAEGVQTGSETVPVTSAG
jgi:hypothetical protein